MDVKKASRLRRAARTRRKIRELEVPRVCVHKTPRHMYAQLISADGANVLASASTLDKEVKGRSESGSGVHAAKAVGQILGDRIKASGVSQIAFDRSGYPYHGRVKAIAEALREGGIKF